MSDDDLIDGEDLESAMLIEVDPEAEPLDPDAADLEDEDDSFGFENGDGSDDGGADADDLDLVATTPETVVKKTSDDDDDDDEDLQAEDDVEADLDSILREKLTAAEEVPLDDDEENLSVDDKTDGMERLQPRRADEIQCTHCFLLVRNSAPGCPVEDDECPLSFK